MQALFDKYRVPEKDQKLILNQIPCSLSSYNILEDAVNEDKLKGLVISKCVLTRNGLLMLEKNLLHQACSLGNIEFVKFALGIGIDINSREYYSGMNGLHYVVERLYSDPQKYIQVAKYLLDLGIDYKQRDYQNKTPLDMITTYSGRGILDYIQEMELR